MMLKSNYFKKFVSILMTALVMFASMPGFAESASGITQFFYTDFNDLDNVDFTTFTSKGKELYSQSTHGVQVRIQGCAYSATEGSRTYLSKGSDQTYGNTLVLTSQNTATDNLGIDINAKTDSSKATIIKTVVKKSSSKTDADLRIWARGINSDGNSSDNYGVRFVNFSKDGKLYVNDDQVDTTQKQTVGTYDLDTWYEITIEYSAVNNFSKVIINGGCYENMVFYNTNMNGNRLERIQIGFGNRSKKAESVMHVGYIDITEDTDNYSRSYDGMQLDDRYTFDRLPANGSAVTSQYLGYVGLEVNKSDYRNNTFVQNVDADHGVSLVTDHSDYVDGSSYLVELRYVFDKAPHRRAYSNGTIVVEYEVKMDEGMMTGLNSVFKDDGTLGGSNIGNRDWIKVGSEYNGMTVEAGKWYKYMRIIDYNNDSVRTVFYDPENPSQFYEREYGDPSSSGEVVRLVLKTDRDPAVTSTSSTVAFDNLHVYTTSDFDFDAQYPASGSTLPNMYDSVALSYSAPVASAHVVVTNHGEVVDASLYTVAYAGKSIVVEPKDNFAANGDYAVTVTEATDIFGNTLSDSQTLSFTTGDEEYTFVCKILDAENNDAELDPANLKAGDKIKIEYEISGNVKFPLMHVVGIFDKSGSELKDMLFYNESADELHNLKTDESLVLTLEKETSIRIFGWNLETYKPLVDCVTLNIK